MKRFAVLLALCCACAGSYGMDLIYGFNTNTLNGFWAPDEAVGSTIAQNFEAPQEGISCMRCSFTGVYSTICRKDALEADFTVSDYNTIIFSWRNTNAGWIIAGVRLTVDGVESALGEVSSSGKRDGLWHEQSFTWTNAISLASPVGLRFTLLNNNEAGWFDIDNIRFANSSNFEETVAWSMDESSASNVIQDWYGNNARLSVNTTIQTQGAGCAECSVVRCSGGSGSQWYNFMNQALVQALSNINWSTASRMKWWYRIPTDFTGFQFLWNATYGTNAPVQVTYNALVSDTWYQATLDLPGMSGGQLLRAINLNAWLGAGDAWPAASNKVFYLDAISFMQEIPEPYALLGLPLALALLRLRTRR